MAEYTNIPLYKVYEIDAFTFWALLRDAVIYNHSQTEEGRKWLKNAHRLTVTSPDSQKLKEKLGEGGQK